MTATSTGHRRSHLGEGLEEVYKSRDSMIMYKLRSLYRVILPVNLKDNTQIYKIVTST